MLLVNFRLMSTGYKVIFKTVLHSISKTIACRNVNTPGGM
jgi:hypothetical protein